MHKFKLTRVLLRSVFILFVVLNLACIDNNTSKANKNNKEASTALGANQQSNDSINYDLTKMEKFIMPDALMEISGIALNQLDPKMFYAIQDEDGLLYRFALGDKKLNSVKFAAPGDYEDLSIINNQVIVLKSNGTLYKFPINLKSTEINQVKEYKKIVPKAEYEGLFADPETNLVYVLTKEQKETKYTSIYVLKITDSGFENVEEKTITNEMIHSFLGGKKIKFKPSALAKNPVTKNWFILSSVNQMLMELNPQFEIMAIKEFETGDFVQPEGLTFDLNQNLYISNEGDALNAGNILKFVPLRK